MNTNKSILIIDDDESLCKTMSFILKRKGFDIRAVTSGLIAVELVKQKPFDFVLLDIKMPEIDGIETIKRIKKTKFETKVIMTTAYAVQDKIDEALKIGAVGVIYKPVDIDTVISFFQKA
jgi:DNA-binding NtrC family response regulator